jgi:hypothetical protein
MQNALGEQLAPKAEASEIRPALLVVTPSENAHWERATVTIEYVESPTPMITVVTKRKTN